MRSDDLPFPIQSFLSKLKYFTIFNIIFLLWALAMLIFYIITTSDINCSKSNPIPSYSEKPIHQLDLQLWL